MENQEIKKILAEILPVPSQTVIADRFSAGTETAEATCNGMCSSGACKTFF